MKVEIENLEGHKKKITIEIPAEHVDHHFDGYYRDVQKRVELKGFRKGKAPMQLVRQLYSDSAPSRIMQDLVEGHLRTALRDHSLSPVSMPQVDVESLKEKSPFKFSATFEASPPVELKDYQSLKLEKVTHSVDPSEVEKTLENIRTQFASFKPCEEGTELASGHIAKLDYEAEEAGKPVVEASEKDAHLEIGAGSLAPDFEKNILGMKKGEVRDFEVKFAMPEKEEEKTPVSGRTLSFKVTLGEISTRELPELNEEFVKRVGPFQNLEDLKKRIEEDLLNEKNKRQNSELNEKAAAWLIENNPVEATDILVNQQIEQLAIDAGMQLSQMGLTQEVIEERLKQWGPEMQERATKQVKLSLLLGEISKRDGIKASDDELRQEITRIALQSKKTVKEVFEDFQQRGVLSGLVRQITELKTLKSIVDKALSA